MKGNEMNDNLTSYKEYLLAQRSLYLRFLTQIEIELQNKTEAYDIALRFLDDLEDRLEAL